MVDGNEFVILISGCEDLFDGLKLGFVAFG
jgi:hypothetical protein